MKNFLKIFFETPLYHVKKMKTQLKISQQRFFVRNNMKVWLNDNFEKIVEGVPKTAEEKKDHVKIQVEEICFYLCKFPWIKGDDMSINIFVKYLMINFNCNFFFFLNHQILIKMVINLGHCIGSNVILNDHSLFKVWEYICLATFSEGRGCRFCQQSHY